MSLAAPDLTILRSARERYAYRVRSGRRKTVMTMVWVVVALLAAEGGVRVRQWYRHGTGGPIASIYEPDELLGRRPRPGATLQGHARSLTINRWGFRGQDIPKRKPPGTIRIAAIGDSVTFGMEAGTDEATWVTRLGRLLNNTQNATRYDMLNGAVPGYRLATSIARLTERIAPFQPDIVIALHVASEIPAHGKRQLSAARAAPPARSGLAKIAQRHSLLLNLIRVNTVSFRAKHSPQQRHGRLDDRGIVEYIERLESLVEICRQHGRRLVLCTCARSFGDDAAPTDQYTLAATALANSPFLSLEGLNDAYARYNQAVRSVARKHGILLVDLDRVIPKRRIYFVDAVHLTDAGHGLVAEAVAAALVENRVDREPAPERP